MFEIVVGTKATYEMFRDALVYKTYQEKGLAQHDLRELLVNALKNGYFVTNFKHDSILEYSANGIEYSVELLAM